MELDGIAKKQLAEKGISLEKFETQLNNFQKGFPFSNLQNPATEESGIFTKSEEEIENLANLFDRDKGQNEIIKFVPASGAASRMFKFLFEASNAEIEPTDKDYKTFFEGIEKFPFFENLSAELQQLAKGKFEEKRKFLKVLLNEKPFAFGKKPKAMIPFHKTNNLPRLAIEEHFAETEFFGANNGKLQLHFTISPEHKTMFELESEKLKLKYQSIYPNGIEVTFSEQMESTDMVAVLEDNSPVKTTEGFLFRPGGHGALIENLNNLNADLIFIKNIDNVLPPFFHAKNGKYKRFMGGVLLQITKELFQLQKNFSEYGYSEKLAYAAQHFAKSALGISFININSSELLKSFLFKPVRVCGMVKNEGEPGGGPFWVKQTNGATTLQIVEKSQVDLNNAKQVEILNSATHFNPVDIVCSTKNYAGKKYNLLDFVDSETGFITEKSHEGKTIKAQELPGLWNGAMANWHTVFVEVPLVTFNPVKTINDLLKPNHLKG